MLRSGLAGLEVLNPTLAKVSWGGYCTMEPQASFKSLRSACYPPCPFLHPFLPPEPSFSGRPVSSPSSKTCDLFRLLCHSPSHTEHGIPPMSTLPGCVTMNKSLPLSELHLPALTFHSVMK